MNRYRATLPDVLSPKFERLVCKVCKLVCLAMPRATKDISTQSDQSVNLLHECIMIRDNVFTLPVFYTLAIFTVLFYIFVV